MDQKMPTPATVAATQVLSTMLMDFSVIVAHSGAVKTDAELCKIFATAFAAFAGEKIGSDQKHLAALLGFMGHLFQTLAAGVPELEAEVAARLAIARAKTNKPLN